MKRTVPLAIALLVLLGPSCAGADVPAKWTRWLADTPDTTIRSLDFIGPNLFAAGESNGVFSAHADTGPWMQQNGGLDSVPAQSVRQVKASPDGEVYACTSAGLFKSGAGGTTSWTPVGQGSGERKL